MHGWRPQEEASNSHSLRVQHNESSWFYFSHEYIKIFLSFLSSVALLKCYKCIFEFVKYYNNNLIARCRVLPKNKEMREKIIS